MSKLAALFGALLGVWLTLSPAVLGYGEAPRTAHHLLGPIVSTLAVVALSQATSALRLVNAPIGAWLALAPLVMSHPLNAALSSVLVGVALATSSLLFPDRPRWQQGGGWAVLWRDQRDQRDESQ